MPFVAGSRNNHRYVKIIICIHSGASEGAEKSHELEKISLFEQLYSFIPKMNFLCMNLVSTFNCSIFLRFSLSFAEMTVFVPKQEILKLPKNVHVGKFWGIIKVCDNKISEIMGKVLCL